MNSAARPLELQLRSERDLVGTRRIERESRTALIGKLSDDTRQTRRRLISIVLPLVVLATAAIGVAVAF